MREINLIIKNCGECPYSRYESPYIFKTKTLVCGFANRNIMDIDKDDFSFDAFKVEIPGWCSLEIKENYNKDCKDCPVLESCAISMLDDYDDNINLKTEREQKCIEIQNKRIPELRKYFLDK